MVQLKQVAAGIPALSPSVARRIMQHFQRTGLTASEETLTLRERKVLGMIGRGLRNAEVAQALQLSENAIAGYIKGIYWKLGISSRAEASWHAARLGLGTSDMMQGHPFRLACQQRTGRRHLCMAVRFASCPCVVQPKLPWFWTKVLVPLLYTNACHYIHVLASLPDYSNAIDPCGWRPRWSRFGVMFI
ncbi:response regulator transcription factor [Natronohydrobacter thiooxidans]|uniref:response regulator transcription factor n=1 Tax=Natronohydrobacter thiooxidans TaxID=87172 RepID=UPI001FE37698|nr:LuxR C-terminal-related transcriptional regulator [Natronohydrobacter thiooxidans]